jgi:hypothetical protein
MLTVTVLPNQRRPDAGRSPSSEPRRPWLPQHARLCPVLEAGSSLGFLLFAPLREGESYQIRYLADHSYRFSFYINDQHGNPDLAFAIATTPSAGGGGLMADELIYRDPAYGMDDQTVRGLKDAMITNLNTPAGAVGLRGATDFRTPEGWDTVYTAVLNNAEPPVVPVLSARVQTDWYAHNTEFRYLLAPGGILSVNGVSPIGQVFFVPRQEVRLCPASSADIAAFQAAQRQYWEEKASDQLVAPYGIAYSPHYRKVSRGQPAGRPSDTEESHQT